MKKIMLILRHEMVTILTSKSFLFVVFGLPLIGSLVFWAASLLNKNNQASSVLSAVLSNPIQVTREGYVDLSGLVRLTPTDVLGDALKPFPDEASARQALADEDISAFYIITKDYLTTGSLIYIRQDFSPFGDRGASQRIKRLLDINLLNGDVHLAERVDNPLNVSVQATAPGPQRDQANPLTFFLPYGVTIIYYAIILGAASLLLNSVTKEKENRVIEILMISASPSQLLTGKIIGLGMIGLLQTVAWIGTSYVLLRLSGRTFNLPAAFQLPVSFLVWGLVFFLLGYAIYASLMAGLGALAPNLKEASQATFMIILPLLVPMMLISVLIESPNGPLAVFLSLFPLTAPVGMMTRLAATRVPTWQLLLAALLLVLTAWLILRMVARMFRAQALLSGQSFELKRFLGALLGR